MVPDRSLECWLGSDAKLHLDPDHHLGHIAVVVDLVVREEVEVNHESHAGCLLGETSVLPSWIEEMLAFKENGWAISIPSMCSEESRSLGSSTNMFPSNVSRTWVFPTKTHIMTYKTYLGCVVYFHRSPVTLTGPVWVHPLQDMKATLYTARGASGFPLPVALSCSLSFCSPLPLFSNSHPNSLFST